MDGVLTVAEAAKLLRVSRATVGRLMKSGELASFTIGARRLLRESAVQAYLDRRAAERGAP